MKKYSYIILMSVLCACGGGVTDEQRKQMREASEQQEIVKVTDAQVTEAAYEKGRAIMKKLESGNPENDFVEMNRLQQENFVKINLLTPGTTHGREIEQQLIDSYLNSLMQGSSLQDNVQKIGRDSLLYTSPIVITRADSSIEIKGTWNVWMSKRQVIMGMNRD